MEWKWAIGVEHEMQIFKLPSFESIMKHYTVLDTEMHCKYLLSNWNKLKKKNDKVFTKKNYNFLQDVVMRKFEQTGRKCDGKWVVKPLVNCKNEVIKMPEFVSTQPFAKKSIEEYCEEIIKQQERFFGILNHCPKIKNEAIPFPFGMSNYIKAENCSKFQKDYLGSFHITITLPFTNKTSNKLFIERHKNFACQIQWIEPLLVAAFFSGDDKALSSNQKLIKGSWRVAAIGWGNFAGSDVRKLNKGIGRMSNINFNWRKNMNFVGKKKVEYCKKLSPAIRAREPSALSGFSSDFRTFGGPEHESGYPMEKPNGVELRIFDNIPTTYTPILCRILVYAAENSRKHKCKTYVYHDKDWVKSLDNIMMNGWRGEVTRGYLTKLRKNLGLKINTKSLNCWDILKQVNKELFYKNNKGLFSKLLLKKEYKKPPSIMCLNRNSLESGLIIKINNSKTYRNKIIKMYKDLPYKFKSTNMDEDIIYFFQTIGLLRLVIKDGKIVHCIKKLNKTFPTSTQLSNILVDMIYEVVD